MDKLTNGFARLSDSKLEEKAQFIITQIGNNVGSFATPDPALTVLQDALAVFNEAVTAAKTGDRFDIAIKTQKKQDLVELLQLELVYVEYIAKGDPVILASSGFDLAKQPSPTPELTKPENLKVINSDQSGELIISVDAVPNAVSYLHQFSIDPLLKDSSWQSLTSSQSKNNLTNLTPGVLYYCRVGAVGRKNQVMFSDVVSRIAA